MGETGRRDGADGTAERRSGEWSCLPLSPGLTVVATAEAPCLPEDVEARVEAIWTEARSVRPGLFNGRIFCADRLTPDRIEGHWDEYRRALAQIREPGLFGDRPLRQLAVCGALLCPEGVVIARRAPSALYFGGFWQSPPAGTVESRGGCDDLCDDLCLADQIAAEAEEELGLTRDMLEIGPPLLAVVHAGSEVVDIGIRLETGLSCEEIRRRWEGCGNREYDRISVLSPGERSCWRDRGDVLPTTRRLLEMIPE
ncbi:phosphohydrolase [Acetobacter musti]|uniref:Phosphohydrolase n=1 Tax=Acetobacter musti TaxID=864732 RepID=A0ABX0JN42_9PROT|nr:phosphohydrolase [Acetobacter musti]NHN84647.1 phosphohydrolase [Acetobacter musti]